MTAIAQNTASNRTHSGIFSLVRLALRRDRIMLVVVMVLVWLFNYYTVTATKQLYSTPAEMTAANMAANASTGVVAMYGHIYNVGSIGGLSSTKMGMMNYLIIAFLVIALVRRHTRADEETGRTELVGSTPVARHAPLTASVGLAVFTSLLTGLVTALCVIAGGWPANGSLLYGLALTATGLAFTGITAIAVQLSASNRTCGMWAFGAIGASFVLRMVGDIKWNTPAHVLSWISPIGWSQQVRPFDGDRGWVLFIPLTFFIVAIALTYRLRAGRDLGAGLVAERSGHAVGSMSSPFGLAWRLQRGSFIAWLICFALLGFLMGSLASQMGSMLTGQSYEILQQLGGVGHLAQLYLTLINVLAALGATAFAIATIMRLRSEETSGHAEVVLATATGRNQFFLSYLWQAFIGSAVLLAAFGATAASSYTQGNWGQTFAMSLVSIPAVWLMASLTVVVVGWLPRFDWLGWGIFGLIFALDEFGGLLKFPDWVSKISPFAHTPHYPVDPMTWTPIIVMTMLAAIVIAVGIIGYRRRDIPIG